MIFKLERKFFNVIKSKERGKHKGESITPTTLPGRPPSKYTQNESWIGRSILVSIISQSIISVTHNLLYKVILIF